MAKITKIFGKLQSALLLTVLLPTASVDAALWYVDGSATGANDGTSWANAWTGVSLISGVNDGDTIYISGGPSGSSQTYPTTDKWAPAGGSAGSPITYQIGQDSAHNGTAIFSGSSGSGGWIDANLSYVVISGDAGDGKMHFAVTNYGWPGDGNNDLDVRFSYINFGQLGGNFKFNPGTGIEFDHNYAFVNDPGASDFIYMNGSIQAWDSIKIHDNTIYLPRLDGTVNSSGGNGADCLEGSGDGVSFYNNHIEGYTTNYTGNEHQDGWQPLGGYYCKAYGNTFVNIANYAIFGDAYYSDFQHFWVYNNVVVLSDPALRNTQGIAIGPDGGAYANLGRWPNMVDVVIANNVIDSVEGGAAISLWNPPPAAASVFTNCLVANNILVDSGGPQLDPSVVTADNVSLTSAQAVNSFLSYTYNSANNNYHLIAGARSLIGTGANESAYFTTDKDGRGRPASGAWDIGAYQYAYKVVAAGFFHGLAVKPDGTVRAWGQNTDGQVGDGTLTQRSSPVTVSGLTGIKMVAAGYYHSLALAQNGTAWAWGYNSSGQLGGPYYTYGSTYQASPIQVSQSTAPLTNITYIAAGQGSSYAVLGNGTVWTWGDNSYGELGHGYSGSLIPAPMQVSGLSGVSQVAAGAAYALALTTNGAVYAWGNNAYGQLGDGTTTQRNSPVLITGLSDIVDITAGQYCSYALDSSGQVWVWGINSEGQLGFGTTNTVYTPVANGSLTAGIVGIAAGWNFCQALLNDGTLLAWGVNTWGQLGDGTTTTRSSPVPVGFGDGSQAVGIAASGTFSLSVQTDGTLRSWGSNSFGQLGRTTSGSYSTTPGAITGF